MYVYVCIFISCHIYVLCMYYMLFSQIDTGAMFPEHHFKLQVRARAASMDGPSCAYDAHRA